MLSETVLGIDIEWRPTFVSGQPPNRVALLQISSCTRTVLVPVRHLSRLPAAAVQLLSSPQIWKVGCGVREDARKLEADCGLRVAPVLEIGDVATLLQGAAELTFPALPEDERVRPGLRGLALACGYELSKPKSVARSNWERRPLTPQQQRYAALDAYAGAWIAASLHALHARHSPRHAVSPKLARWCEEQAQRLQTARAQRA
jgi:ribonuclease D